MEYILYGENGETKTDATIYLIRFALNSVYAFTDAEIANITTATATALFGTPPLTPLIPVAKIAMTLGFALAESAYDLYMIKQGEKIPLYKSSDTFVMKPSSAAKVVMEDLLNKAASYVIDEGLTVLDDLLDMTADDLNDYISKSEGDLTKLSKRVVDSTTNKIKDYANSAVQKMTDYCMEVIAMPVKDSSDPAKIIEMVNAVVEKLEDWLRSQKETDSEIIYKAKEAAVDYLIDPKGTIIKDYLSYFDPSVKNDTASSLTDDEKNEGKTAAEKINEKIDSMLASVENTVNDKVDELIKSAGNVLHDGINQLEDKLKAAAKDGADSLKSSIKDHISSALGTGDSASEGTGSVMNTLFSWGYSDYLQLFVLAEMIISPDSILLRTADLIQLNVNLSEKRETFVEQDVNVEVSRFFGLIRYNKTETVKVATEDSIRLKNSYSYLKIRAQIAVKPIMLSIPLIADTIPNSKGNDRWYLIDYEGILSY